MISSFAWTTRDLVTVSGPDAAAYLQGQVSQDVAALAVGGSAATFVLAPQGKVDGWGRIHRCGAEEFEIDVDTGAGAAWAARLRRFLLRTKAEIGVSEAVSVLAVRGIEVDGGRRALGLGVVGSDLFGVAPPGRPAGVPHDAVELSAEDLEALRIRAGVPRWGAELDDGTIPATVGQWAIDASVSFTKGCFTGQELVARIDSRGGNVPRHLVGLVIDGAAPAPGADVQVDGVAAGSVTSSAPSGSGSVALAFVPRSVEVGADGVAATAGGLPALIRTLPLPTP